MSAGAIMMVGANGAVSADISSFTVTAGNVVIGYKSLLFGYDKAAAVAGSSTDETDVTYGGAVNTTDFLLQNGAAATLNENSSRFLTNDSFKRVSLVITVLVTFQGLLNTICKYLTARELMFLMGTLLS